MYNKYLKKICLRYMHFKFWIYENEKKEGKYLTFLLAFEIYTHYDNI